MVQVDADQHEMVIAGHHAVQGFLDGGAASLDVRGGERGQCPRVALAAGDRLQDVAGRLRPGQRVHHR